MKRALLMVVLCLAACVLPLNSRQLGVKAGLNIAGLNGDYVVDLESLSGARFGAFLCLDLSGGLKLQPELYYVRKGASYETTGVYESIAYTLEADMMLDYIEIPLLLKYVVHSGSLEPFFFAGPYYAFQLAAKSEMVLSFEGYSDTVAEKKDMEEIKSSDFGLVFGAGLNIPLGRLDLILDARYSIGLSDIADAVGEDFRNGVFSLQAGLGF